MRSYEIVTFVSAVLFVTMGIVAGLNGDGKLMFVGLTQGVLIASISDLLVKVEEGESK